MTTKTDNIKNIFVQADKTTYDRHRNGRVATCREGGVGFLHSMAQSAGSDLVYSLALEKGNIFLCVTAFPELTDKKFASSEDGMRAIFIIAVEEYDLPQDDMVARLTILINDQIYYEKDLTPVEDLLNDMDPELVQDALETVKKEIEIENEK